MAEPYGAIFEPGSPAASAGIEKGDLFTAINGSPVMRSSEDALNHCGYGARLTWSISLHGAMAKISSSMLGQW
jgi:hypothetical protein